MATTTIDFSDLDSSGEALGDGLGDDSAIGYSGPLTPSLDDTELGSPITLAPSFSSGLSIFDQPTGLDSLALTGQSDGAPSASSDVLLVDLDDDQIGGTNGAGTAATSSLTPISVSSSASTSGVLSAVAKFGSAIGSMFAEGQAPATPIVSNSAYSAPKGIPLNLTLIALLVIALFVIAISFGE